MYLTVVVEENCEICKYYTHPPISPSSHFTLLRYRLLLLPFIHIRLGSHFLSFAISIPSTDEFSLQLSSIPISRRFFRHGSASCQEGRRLRRRRYLLHVHLSLCFRNSIWLFCFGNFELVSWFFLPAICVSIDELWQISLILSF